MSDQVQLYDQHCEIAVRDTTLGGVNERTLSITSDFGLTQLTLKEGDLHTLCITNFSVGSSFEHLTDNALMAIKYEIERYLTMQHNRRRFQKTI